jgi:hypothetical protein
MVLAGGISVFMGTSRDWDFLHYHFYDGYALLHHRLNIDFAPAGLWSFFNPLLDAFNAFIILNIQNTFWILFLFGAICGLGFFVFYQILCLIFENVDSPAYSKNLLILYTFFTGITAPSAFSQVGATQNDFQTTSFILLGIYCALRGLIHPKNTSLFLLFAGLCTGVAIGLKLTNGTYLIGLGVAIFLSAPKNKKIPFSALIFSGFMVGLLASNGWWMWILYEKFKSPFFPFYNAIFQSPDYPFLNYKDVLFSIHHWQEIFLRPFQYATLNRWASEQTMSDPRLMIALLLSIFLAVRFFLKFFNPSFKSFKTKGLSDQNKKIMFFLFSYLWASYLIWVIQFGIYRYAIPIELIASTFIFFTLGQHLFTTKNQRILTALIFFLIYWTTTVMIPVRPPFMPKDYIVVESPRTPLPKDSLIVMTSVKQSFVAPFFPSNVTYASPYFIPDSPSPIESPEAIQKIQEHANQKKPIYLLFGHDAQDNPNHSIETLKMAGLVFKTDLSSCETLYTNTYRQKALELCKSSLVSFLGEQK